MGLFDIFFRRKEEPAVVAAVADSDWEEMAVFEAADAGEYELVSIIATAIATGEHRDSRFVVKRILKRNSEVSLVTLIAASIATGNGMDSRFSIKKISKKAEK